MKDLDLVEIKPNVWVSEADAKEINKKLKERLLSRSSSVFALIFVLLLDYVFSGQSLKSMVIFFPILGEWMMHVTIVALGFYFYWLCFRIKTL